MKSIISVILGAAFATALVWTYEANAQDKRYCRNNEGEVIIVTAPYLCPVGYWEI